MAGFRGEPASPRSSDLHLLSRAKRTETATGAAATPRPRSRDTSRPTRRGRRPRSPRRGPAPAASGSRGAAGAAGAGASSARRCGGAPREGRALSEVAGRGAAGSRRWIEAREKGTRERGGEFCEGVEDPSKKKRFFSFPCTSLHQKIINPDVPNADTRPARRLGPVGHLLRAPPLSRPAKRLFPSLGLVDRGSGDDPPRAAGLLGVPISKDEHRPGARCIDDDDGLYLRTRAAPLLAVDGLAHQARRGGILEGGP